ncbi:hypothetical protein H4219_003826 [Mycoemilia scoparia]|uniref:Tyrosinase copper-binding domain-containing protein n=1 Tax=Mycoemilia scoparia TaxID=417184 RepID=A0A9W7ZTN6_9FUNG|nr:hypothetical protein H4219_003826 [Mycoemilia scoparia]
MKFNISISTLSVVLATLSTFNANIFCNGQQQGQCQSMAVRKNVLRVSQSEWRNIVQTTTRMNQDGWFAWFSYIHTLYFDQVHNNSMLLPFHRRLLRDFELAASQGYDPNFTIPYWDSASDYRAPHKSRVLTSAYVGGNGGANGCVQQDSFQSSWTLTYPDPHCLERRFDGGRGTINPWFSPEYVLSFTQRDRTMAQFRPDLEYSIHGAVHIGIGGDMNPQWSPNDFIFYLHHANMDRLWAIWQYTYNNLWTMDGKGPNGIRNLSINDLITLYNEPIQSVMQLGYGLMCFTYDEISTRTLETSIRSLPQDVLNKYFPVTAKNTNVRRSNIVNRHLNPPPPPQKIGNFTCGDGSRTMPIPVDLSERLYDHNVTPEMFIPKRNDHVNFVNAMNQIGYCS